MNQDGDHFQIDGLIVKSESSICGRSRSRGRSSSRNKSQSRSHAMKDAEYFYYHKKWHYKNHCKELNEHLKEKENGKLLESTSVVNLFDEFLIHLQDLHLNFILYCFYH